VLGSTDVVGTASLLKGVFGLGQPFSDGGLGAGPGVVNAVFALGDTFLEVASPTRPGSAGKRHLDDARAVGGSMVMVQVDDAAARRRAVGPGVRTTWSVDRADIQATQFHPDDVGGTALSLGTTHPPGSWPWGGPGWEGRQGSGLTTGVVGVTIAVDDPVAAATRWLGLIGGDIGSIVFVSHEQADGRSGLVEIELATADPGMVGAEVAVGPCTVRAVDS
jgi:hypothetical protein